MKDRSLRKLHREKILNILPMIEYEEFPQAVLHYYDQHQRNLPWRKDPSPYHVWISEIMLQQTRVETVIPYYEKFLKKLPKVMDLAKATEDELHKLWEGLGYYRRVNHMKKAAIIMVEENKGELPKTYQELLTLPGIGPYTAAAIASISYGEVIPAMDGNLYRIMSRVLGEDGFITKRGPQKFLTEETYLRMDHKRPGAFNQGLMDIGAGICIPNGKPLCDQCPIIKFCYAYHQGNPMEYPVKPAKKSRKIEHRTILLLQRGNQVALLQRPKTGLLAGLWEFPSLQGDLEKEDVLSYLESKVIPVKSIEKLLETKHIFSHIEWHMVGYFVRIKDIPMARENDTFTWASFHELEEEYALPSAFENYRNFILKHLKKGMYYESKK
ncbi:MAG: A/G-specific adenine glycosylase [Tissierellia bacterium]|nr:A/G-specific adenine glycosylase [Tissierellia bacterium]